MTLLADERRCGGLTIDLFNGSVPSGVVMVNGQCARCYRRTAPPIYHPRQVWMSPPQFVDGRCPERLRETMGMAL